VRILFTVHHVLDEDTGAPGATIDLARACRELGHKAEIYAHDALPGRLPGRGRELLFPWAVCAHLLREPEPPDAVDASTGDAWLWGTLRRSGDRPLLVTRSHGLEHEVHRALLEEVRRGHMTVSRRYRLYRGGLRLWEVGRSLRVADGVIFLNGRERDLAVDELGVDASRTAVIPCGLRESLLRLPLEPTPAPGETVGVAVVASYIPRKGTAYVRDAVVSLLARRDDVRVTFLGTGWSPERVLADFGTDFDGRIRVVPSYARTELPTLLRGHHVKMLASVAEGFGVALLETMACGLAPIVTSTTGGAELVQDGVAGLIVPPRDPRALHAAVERLADDRDLLGRLRERAQATAQTLSWARVAGLTMGFYEEQLELKRARAAARSRR
jgi:glycosyltransferase involved in cell wall biosynthesis